MNSSGTFSTVCLHRALYTYEIKLNYDRDSRSSPLGFYLSFYVFFILHPKHLPRCQTQIIRSFFCGKNICYTVSPRRSRKFLKFPSTPRETAANSVRSFSVCHFKTFLPVTCMSLFRVAGG